MQRVFGQPVLSWANGPKKLILLAGILGLLGSTGCVSARMSDRAIDRAFYAGDYDGAAARLAEGLKDQGENGIDRLLFLLDLGITLHTAGKYDESNRYLLEADKLADIKDYTSLAAEAATLIVSDNTKDYKGEDFENVLINAYLAMNYAALGDFENALVESRRVNRKIYLMVTEGKRQYKQSAFAQYLSGVLYESQGEWNDALVSYKKTRELVPDFKGIGLDLWRMAWRLHMDDEMEKWQDEYAIPKEERSGIKKSKGLSEIIVLYQNGNSPLKHPGPIFHEIPVFLPRANPVLEAQVSIDGEDRGKTQVLDQIEATAISNLEEKYAGIIAKKIAGRVAKGAIGYGVAKAANSRVLGELTNLILVLADQADLRSWSLLPRDIQIARITVEPGVHHIRVLPVGAAPLIEKTIEVKAGKKVFVPFRYVP